MNMEKIGISITISVILCLFINEIAHTASALSAAPEKISNTQNFGNTTSKKDQNISNQFIVTLRDNSSSSDIQDVISSVKKKGAEILQIYEHAIKGFSMRVPSTFINQTINFLNGDPRVIKVERDLKVYIAPLK
jgi:hypothetical protein